MKFAFVPEDHLSDCTCRDCRSAAASLARLSAGGVVHRGCSIESRFAAIATDTPEVPSLAAAIGDRRGRLATLGTGRPLAKLEPVAPPSEQSPELRDAEQADDEMPAPPSLAAALAERTR